MLVVRLLQAEESQVLVFIKHVRLLESLIIGEIMRILVLKVDILDITKIMK